MRYPSPIPFFFFFKEKWEKGNACASRDRVRAAREQSLCHIGPGFGLLLPPGLWWALQLSALLNWLFEGLLLASWAFMSYPLVTPPGDVQC